MRFDGEKEKLANIDCNHKVVNGYSNLFVKLRSLKNRVL